MMKKRWKTVLLAAVFAAMAAGCGQKDTQPQDTAVSQETDGAKESAAEDAGQKEDTAADTKREPAAGEGDLLSRIREKGEIVIATEGTWAPWTFHDENDNLVGYDVEVAQKIAEKLGVTATFVEGEWDGLFAGLDSGRYDIVANGVEVTDERAEKYDFSDPYGYIRTAIIVRGDNEEITSFEDLNGKTTANTLASTYALLAESYGANATGVDDLNQTIELLLAGRVDATLNAEVTFYDYKNAHPESDLKVAALTEEASLVCIPFRKEADSDSLREAVNQAVAELSDSGELSELSQKYFGSDISQKE